MTNRSSDGIAAVPFRLRRSHDVIGGGGITSTQETVHGLVRVTADGVSLQWRVEKTTDRVGPEIRTDREVGQVQQVELPLSAFASAEVRRSWWAFWRSPRLVLTAADLRALEAVAGEHGLALDHPAQLVLPLRRQDRLAGQALCAELNLAVADLALREAERLPALGAPASRALDSADDRDQTDRG